MIKIEINIGDDQTIAVRPKTETETTDENKIDLERITRVIDLNMVECCHSAICYENGEIDRDIFGTVASSHRNVLTKILEAIILLSCHGFIEKRTYEEIFDMIKFAVTAMDHMAYTVLNLPKCESYEFECKLED